MTTCVPVRDMKDTSAFSRLVSESTEPIIVTKNGYDHLAVMTTDAYDAILAELAELRLLRRVAEAEEERVSGRVKDGALVFAEAQMKYGL